MTKRATRTVEADDIVLTDHAQERMKLRRVTKVAILSAVRDPDDKFIEDDGDTRFIRDVNDREVQVVAKRLEDEKKWLIKSVWVRGEDDPGTTKAKRSGTGSGATRKRSTSSDSTSQAQLIRTVIRIVQQIIKAFTSKK
jgi:hypothetical protein